MGRTTYSLNRREKSNKRISTGVPGISFSRTASNRRDGTVQSFFCALVKYADGRPRRHRFCLDTLGRTEAWRRAVAARAAYELTATAKHPPTHA
jgi:hypothetical protein